MNTVLNEISLETRRLTLRTPEVIDVAGLWPHMSDASITTFLAWEPHSDQSRTLSIVESLRQNQIDGIGYHWVIEYESEIVGLVSLIDVRRDHLTWTLNRGELAYWIAPEFQGRGFATEAATAVLRYAFQALCLEKVRVAHALENIASQRVSERLGFRFYAHERRAFRKNSQWHDMIWYDLLRDEFLHLKDI